MADPGSILRPPGGVDELGRVRGHGGCCRRQPRCRSSAGSAWDSCDRGPSGRLGRSGRVRARAPFRRGASEPQPVRRSLGEGGTCGSSVSPSAGRRPSGGWISAQPPCVPRFGARRSCAERLSAPFSCLGTPLISGPNPCEPGRPSSLRSSSPSVPLRGPSSSPPRLTERVKCCIFYCLSQTRAKPSTARRSCDPGKQVPRRTRYAWQLTSRTTSIHKEVA